MKSVLTVSASQRRGSRFLPKRSPLLRSLEDRLRLTRFESCRKSIVDFHESSLPAAALDSVRPIYGNGTDLLAYFSVHSNPYAAIVSEFSASVETAIENAHSANAADREEADEASGLAYEVADNAAYAAYVTALAQLETAYQTAVSAANAAFNTAAGTAEAGYTMTVTPALHQYEQDYEYLTSLYSQAVKIIEDGGTVSATYLTDDTISFTVCFVAGTPVLLADGTVKPIEEVRPGDRVLAADHLNPGEAESAEVVRVFDNGFKTVVRLVFDRQTVVCTPEHPFFVPGKGWKTASELENGDQCVSADGGKILFERREDVDEPQRVYNFEVEGKHTYYVGTTPQDSVLVHNVCSSCGASDCSGPKSNWKIVRWMFTGDSHACNNLLKGSFQGAKEGIKEGAANLRKVTETLSYVDPTPISDICTVALYGLEGNFTEAGQTLFYTAVGLTTGGAATAKLLFGAKSLCVVAKLAHSAGIAKVAGATKGLVSAAGKITAAKAGVAVHHAGAFVASAVSTVGELLGQKHHPIPKKVAKALDWAANSYKDNGLEVITSNYRKFRTKAKNLLDHFGYEKWHRELDKEITNYVLENAKELTPLKFINYLKDVYARESLAHKFSKFEHDLAVWIEKYKILHEII